MLYFITAEDFNELKNFITAFLSVTFTSLRNNNTLSGCPKTDGNASRILLTLTLKTRSAQGGGLTPPTGFIKVASFIEKKELIYLIKVYESILSYSLTSKKTIPKSAITPDVRPNIDRLLRSV